MDDSQVSMWLPRGFVGEVQASPWDGKYCFFDATQRGDMYHIRAWQVLQQGKAGGSTWHPPTIIYNYIPTTTGQKKSNEATVEYITEIIPRETWKFVTTWSWAELTRHSVKAPPHEATKYDRGAPRDNSTLQWASINKELSIGPSECTDAIRDSADRQRTHQKKEFTVIPENMVKVKVDNIPDLLNELDQSYQTFFPDKATSNGRKVAVILWRDTLASGGPYPELNTGIESARQIITMLNSFDMDAAFIDVAAKDIPEVLEPGVLKLRVHCGENPYYMDAILKSNLWPESTARDREALWVKHAYYNKRFALVVGLRSGALDNMTFLGIPTVSIGLQDMIGEGRMHKLGGNVFQRINVDYAIPRHAGTALVPSRYFGDLVFQSPVERTGKVSKGQEAPLRSFTPFDARTVRIGILLAATKYLDYKVKPATNLKNASLITAEENRAYWDEEDTGNPTDWNKGIEGLEKADYVWRESYQGELQEPPERCDSAREHMQTSWGNLRKKAETTAKSKAEGAQKKAEKAASKNKTVGGTKAEPDDSPKV